MPKYGGREGNSPVENLLPFTWIPCHPASGRPRSRAPGRPRPEDSVQAYRSRAELLPHRARSLGLGRLPPRSSSCKQMRWPHRERGKAPGVRACRHQNSALAQPRGRPRAPVHWATRWGASLQAPGHSSPGPPAGRSQQPTSGRRDGRSAQRGAPRGRLRPRHPAPPDPPAQAAARRGLDPTAPMPPTARVQAAGRPPRWAEGRPAPRTTHLKCAQVPISKEGQAPGLWRQVIWGTRLTTAHPQLPGEGREDTHGRSWTVVHTEAQEGRLPDTSRDPKRGGALGASAQGGHLKEPRLHLPSGLAALCPPPLAPLPRPMGGSPPPQRLPQEPALAHPHRPPGQLPTRPRSRGPAAPSGTCCPCPHSRRRAASPYLQGEAPPDPGSEGAAFRREPETARHSVDTRCCARGSARQAPGPPRQDGVRPSWPET